MRLWAPHARREAARVYKTQPSGTPRQVAWSPAPPVGRCGHDGVPATRSPPDSHAQCGRSFPFSKTVCRSGVLGLLSPCVLKACRCMALLPGLGQAEVKRSEGDAPVAAAAALGLGASVPHAALPAFSCCHPPAPAFLSSAETLPIGLPPGPLHPQTSPPVGHLIQVPCSPGSLVASSRSDGSHPQQNPRACGGRRPRSPWSWPEEPRRPHRDGWLSQS